MEDRDARMLGLEKGSLSPHIIRCGIDYALWLLGVVTLVEQTLRDDFPQSSCRATAAVLSLIVGIIA